MIPTQTAAAHTDLAQHRCPLMSLVHPQSKPQWISPRTSNVSSLPEVFGTAALLVNPENVFDIARGIRSVLTDQALRENLIARGYERVKCYSWERAAQQIHKAYAEVAGRR